MPRHWDGPATGRLGHGYLQAREAGAPYIPPRSLKEVNREKRELEAAEVLREYCKIHPEHGALIAQAIKDKVPAQVIVAILRGEYVEQE